MQGFRPEQRARRTIQTLALVVATTAVIPVPTAESYPSRPMRMISASAAGSGSDIIGRILSTRLSENMGQQVVVDNRPGAAGMIGAETVANATPDGYTFWLATFTQLISTTLHDRLHLAKEFEPVGLVATTPFIIVASATLPVKTTAEFIAYAKARPGKLLFGSSGTGGSLHICMELFQSMAGLEMTHVPYKALGTAITDLMSGQIHAACPAAPSVTLFANNPKIRVLGVTTKNPTVLAPGLQPIAQALPGFEMPGWYGVLVPKGTPKSIVARIHQEFTKTVNAPDMRDKLITAGAEPAMSSPEEFRAFLTREGARLGKLLKDAGVKPSF
jgi:tripartite-type tricarboxylate transporter receptor subunit TctC